MKKHARLSVLILCAGLSVISTAWADAATQRLEQFFKHVTSMSADFTQSIVSESQPTTQKSQGVLLMQRPGKFRWNYSKPFEQQIVADGKNLWVYDVEMEQVIVKPLDIALGNTPALLLSGNVDITEKFKVTEISQGDSKDANDKGLFWVQLEPKQEESGFEKLIMAFAGSSLQIMELKDAFGQVTRITFSNLKQNPKLDASVFDFKIPPGVDVISDSEQDRQNQKQSDR